MRAGALVDGAQGAQQVHVVGNDVGGRAAVDGTERDDRLVVRVELARDEVLRAEEDMAGDVERVHQLVRARAVAALAVHDDVDVVDGREAGARARGDLAQAVVERHEVDGRGGVDVRVLQHARVDHGLVAADLVGRAALLVGLEHELHAAGQLGLAAFQDAGGAQQHGGVRVVPAGVHVVGRGGEGQPRLLLDGQRVHVGAQHETAARRRVADGGHEAARHDLFRFETDFPQTLGHVGRRLREVEPDFGMLVQPAAVGDDVAFQRFGFFQDTRHTMMPPSLEAGGAPLRWGIPSVACTPRAGRLLRGTIRRRGGGDRHPAGVTRGQTVGFRR